MRSNANRGKFIFCCILIRIRLSSWSKIRYTVDTFSHTNIPCAYSTHRADYTYCSLSLQKINTQQINMSMVPVSHQNFIFLLFSRCSEWETKDSLKKKESCSVSSYIKFIWFQGFTCCWLINPCQEWRNNLKYSWYFGSRCMCKDKSMLILSLLSVSFPVHIL